METYLRCYCSDSQHDWALYLPLAEWWYNSTYQSAIQTTPYEALYGQAPPIHLPYLPGEAIEEEVDKILITREFKAQLLNFHLHRAQQRMQSLANKHRSDRQLKVGDWVYLKIQPYRQVTVSQQAFNKLSAKFYGPYQILEKIGTVAYKLSLPAHVAIHPTIHVSQLKLCHQLPDTTHHPPIIDIASPFCVEPQSIEGRRMIKKGNKAVVQVLIQWKGMSKEQATWEDFMAMKIRFPEFFLEDKGVRKDEGMMQNESG